MKNLRKTIYKSAKAHFVGHIEKHRANVEVLLENPVGIGEGAADILEEIEKELAEIADYDDKLEMLEKYFNK
jgi:hypothetical protein